MKEQVSVKVAKNWSEEDEFIFVKLREHYLTEYNSHVMCLKLHEGEDEKGYYTGFYVRVRDCKTFQKILENSYEILLEEIEL